MSKRHTEASGFASREVGPRGGTPEGQHTPGPWTVGHEMNSERPGSVPVVAMVRDSLEGKMHVAFVNGKAGEQEANARLIAAAPDMLAALRALEVAGMAPMRDRARLNADAWDLARAAIAKATGGVK